MTGSQKPGFASGSVPISCFRRRCRMAAFNSWGKVLTGPVTGRPICEVKPTGPSFRHRRRHLRTVQTEQPIAIAIWVSFQPAAAYSLISKRIWNVVVGQSTRICSPSCLHFGLLKKIIAPSLGHQREYDFLRLDIHSIGSRGYFNHGVLRSARNCSIPTGRSYVATKWRAMKNSRNRVLLGGITQASARSVNTQRHSTLYTTAIPGTPVEMYLVVVLS